MLKSLPRSLWAASDWLCSVRSRSSSSRRLVGCAGTLVGIRGAIGGVEGRLCGRFDSMHGELRDAADRMAYLDGYLTGAAPAIVAAATREIQKREPGTESARELSSTKNPPDAL